MLSDRPLYQRLTEFALDDPGAKLKFSDRLARENGWTVAFAKQAIAEYRKFVYLAAMSPTPITPSDIVDQVWHLHLTYTRSYWEEMCAAILGKPLHHGPTNGGASEDANYRHLYDATLDAYRREFSSEPQAAFWPPSDARFAGASHQRWVDTREHLVFSWRTLRYALTAGVSAVMLGSAGVASAAANAGAKHDVGPALLLLAGLIAAVVGIAAAKSSRRRKHDSSSTDGSGFLWGVDGGSSPHRHDSHHDGQGHQGGHGGEGNSGGESGSGCSSGCGGGGSGCGSS